MASPLPIHVMRGEVLESIHSAHFAVADTEGRLLAAGGDPERPVFPRSSIKALQALPLIESGAADAFSLAPPELALACSSHMHEDEHIRVVTSWLERIGCTAADLGCGLEPPGDARTILALERAHAEADARYNNCSGKHTGFLSVARHLGEPLHGYTEHGHPVQKRIRQVLTEMSGYDVEHAPWARDGCSIPTQSVPLRAWARAMAHLADPSGLGSRRGEAAARLSEAIARCPAMIGGESSWDSNLIRITGGTLLVKRGAEGMACGWLPGQGVGFSLKVADGNPRAVPVAVGSLAEQMGWLDTAAAERAAAWIRPTQRNWNGYEVSALKAVP